MKFEERSTEEVRMNLTPMIDIIFQLLIFFVLTAKFIAFEGQLQAYLPKDRGLQPTTPTLAQNVALFLTWEAPDTVKCMTTQYEMNGDARQSFVFPLDGNAQKVADGYVTKTTIGTGVEKGDIVYDYRVPDFVAVEQYLKYRKDTYRESGAGTKGLPVEINFDNEVPWQMVVNVIDICKRLKITDLALSAEELEY